VLTEEAVFLDLFNARALTGYIPALSEIGIESDGIVGIV
jgi:hypothetical protein